MKKLIFLLFPILLLSCNKLGDDLVEETKKTYELWFYPSSTYDLTLHFLVSNKTYRLFSTTKYEPVKITLPINQDNREVFSLYSYDGHIRIFGQSKYYEIRGMKENEHYRISCIDKIGEIVDEHVESIDIDIKSVSDYK